MFLLGPSISTLAGLPNQTRLAAPAQPGRQSSTWSVVRSGPVCSSHFPPSSFSQASILPRWYAMSEPRLSVPAPKTTAPSVTIQAPPTSLAGHGVLPFAPEYLGFLPPIPEQDRCRGVYHDTSTRVHHSCDSSQAARSCKVLLVGYESFKRRKYALPSLLPPLASPTCERGASQIAARTTLNPENIRFSNPLLYAPAGFPRHWPLSCYSCLAGLDHPPPAKHISCSSFRLLNTAPPPSKQTPPPPPPPNNSVPRQNVRHTRLQPCQA